MAKYLSNRQQNLKIGIVSYTEDKTVLEVTGKVGIGTTNATSKLHVVGDARITGVVTATTFVGALTGTASSTTNIPNLTGAITSNNTTTSLGSFTSANLLTALTDETGSGSAVFATSPTLVTPVLGAASATSINVSGIATINQLDVNQLSPDGSNYGTVLYVPVANGSGGWNWATVASAGAGNLNGIDIREEGTIVGTAGSTTTIDFRGNNIIATGTAGGAIATVRVSDTPTFDSLVVSSGFVGIGTTNATSKLSVVGDANITGVVTATTFVGALTGIAASATQLVTPRTFQITGDVVASPISFDGTGNVSLAATIQPNSVGLGTDTTGDYVRDITGTVNQISVSATSGEGSTPILSIPSQFTAPQDVTVTRDLLVSRNLNVSGNITIGGTSATLFTTELKIADPDIVLGFRTDGSGNDISNDNTANHGGVALASTEGTPLVQLFIAGIETNPATYKKIMWFKSGTFAGLGTDAWLINYAVGIGSTQFPTGTRLAAGNVQFTQNDLSVVRNINSSGIVTATTFVGALTGTATSTTNIPNLTGAITSNNTTTSLGSFSSANLATALTDETGSGSAVFATSPTLVTPVLGAASATSIVVSSGSTFTNGPILVGTGTSTGTASQPLQVTGGAYVSGSVGIGTTNPTSKLDVVGDIKVSGVSTLGTVKISSGIISATVGVVTYYGDGSNLQGVNAFNVINQDINSTPVFPTFASNTGVSSVGISTTKLVFIPATGRLGIGTTSPQYSLDSIGDINSSTIVRAKGIDILEEAMRLAIALS